MKLYGKMLGKLHDTRCNREIPIMKDRKLIIAKEATELIHSMGIDENRFFNSCLINQFQQETFNEKVLYKVDVDRYARVSGLSIGRAFTELHSMAKALAQELVERDLGRGDILYSTFISHFVANEKENSLAIRWNPVLITKISGEQEPGSYISYESKMDKTGSPTRYKLYIILQSHLWRLKNHKEFTLDLWELKRDLDLEDKYKEFRDFRVRVIEPTLKDMAELLGVGLEVEAVRRGRKVGRLRFMKKCKGDAG